MAVWMALLGCALIFRPSLHSVTYHQSPAPYCPHLLRALYERCQAELEQKRAQSGARLRALREQAEQERQARHTQVVDPGTVPGRRRRQQQRPGPASSGGGGSSASHRSQLQPAGSSKDRLLKKLGLGGGSSRHAAAQPRKTVTIIHPPRKPVAAGLPQRQPHAAQQALPSPSSLRQRLPQGLPISPAGSLASVGSSPLPWQQVQAGRTGSTPVRQQLQAASSSPLGQQLAQQQYGTQQQRQQQVAEHQAQRQQVAQLRQQHIEQQRRQQQQQQQQQQKGTVLKPTEAGTKPQLVTAAKVKLQVAELCTSEVLPSSLAGLERQAALPLPSPQQAPLQPGTQGAAAAAKRKPARPTKPQALEEVDLFAGVVEEVPVQPRPPPQPVSQPQHKWAAERSSGGSKTGGGRGTGPPAKKPRQQQAVVPLVEVDLFDGL